MTDNSQDNRKTPSQIEQSAKLLGITSARVLVAVSGGCDSVALLRGLHWLQTNLDVQLVVAHLNHGWRGAESDADAVWVEALAGSLEVNCHVERLDAKKEALTTSASEESARRARYEFLTRAAAEHDCRFVAVGHTADDQTETVLHHILRGTGLAGLRGIAPARPLGENVTLVRPLLGIQREPLENWLSSIGQDWRTDRSNSDTDFTRNRIRNELLPLLEEQFNPQVRRVLATLAQQAGEVSGFVRELAEAALPDVVLSSAENSLRLDATALNRLPPVVLRESLILAWQSQNWPLQGMSFSHWEKLAEIATSGGTITLPGRIDGRLRGTLLVLTRG
ncbi:MAG: tRNA lysidine(34) synthetase TilS [Planctomycetota bacterium]|nr:tRNA lysidine(34) synthetase TilS [Planctomycetota bacterium]MDA1250455.1 tRNA lysidine(34) synthetase TilS [Planctomycetota bacterium]